MAARLRLIRRQLRRERVFLDRNSPLEVYDDEGLRSRFRLPRSLILDVCALVQLKIQRVTARCEALPIQLVVCVGLRFLATGSIYSMLGNGQGLSISTIFRCIHSVCEAISGNIKNFVVFPASREDVVSVKNGFMQTFNFPNVIGAIDGTHIPIVAPKDNEHVYVNRKGFHSLNIQLVCDSQMVFISVVAKFPGRAHDSFIFEQSFLCEKLRQHLVPSGGWLLGDSGYPLRSYLLTPVLNPSTQAEMSYNAAHARTRSIIERVIGLLKARFRCIGQASGYIRVRKMFRVINIIQAAIVLHNICVKANIPFEEEIPQTADDPPAGLPPK